MQKAVPETFPSGGGGKVFSGEKRGGVFFSQQFEKVLPVTLVQKVAALPKEKMVRFMRIVPQQVAAAPVEDAKTARRRSRPKKEAASEPAPQAEEKKKPEPKPVEKPAPAPKVVSPVKPAPEKPEEKPIEKPEKGTFQMNACLIIKSQPFWQTHWVRVRAGRHGPQK